MTWESQAACRPELRPSWLTAREWTDIFFPSLGASLAPARAVCSRCPVQAECACAAEADGIWGGMSGRQRKHLRAGSGRPEDWRVRAWPASLRDEASRLMDLGLEDEAEQLRLDWWKDHRTRSIP
jgi:hypothetical protein